MKFKSLGCVKAATRDFPFLEVVEDNRPTSLADYGFTLVPLHLERHGPWYHSESLYRPVFYSDVSRACKFALSWLDAYKDSMEPATHARFVLGFQEKMANARH